MPEELKKRPESIWKKLTRLFRSGPVVRHKVSAGEQSYEPQGTARAYKKELSSLYAHSLASYGQYERLSRYADYNEMEYCLAGNTLIAVPGGFKTIEELASEFGLDREFIVYSYDHMKGRIVPAVGKQARLTRRDVGYRVKFDNGKEIIGTIDHRLMLRDGSYRKIGELRPGDAMMPFKREHLWKGPYASIYDGSSWTFEHRLLGEFIAGRQLAEDEVVHHIDHQKWNNSIDNLEVMARSEHSRRHLQDFNRLKWNPSNERWIEKFRRNHSRFMTKHNPSARLDVTFPIILQVAELNGFHLFQTMETLDIDYHTIVRRLKEYKFKNWEMFAKAYDPDWQNHGHDNRGEKNPRWDDGLTFQMICNAWEPGIKSSRLAEKLNTTVAKVKGRVKQHGFKSVAVFCSEYKNCRVVSVEVVGEMDLYDLTVDGYKNFATDSVVSHNTPEIASALDIYADEVTAFDEDKAIIKVNSKDQSIKQVLETLFFDVLNIEFNAWSWVRNLCKYGDYILFVDASESNGILNLLPIPINEIEREEKYDKDDPFAIRFRWIAQGNQILENWQVIHFRLLGNEMFLPYGTSMIEPARRIWRQLILIEDAMLVYRIVRSPERRVFKIDVGNIPASEIDQHMEEIQKKLRRNQIIDPSTGRVDLRYNPLSVDEDYFLPSRNGQSSDITTLPGGQFTGDIDDVNYIQSKMFAALKVPKAYLGYEGELGSKATLSQQDVRFARTIERVQKIFIAELNKIAIIHLFLLGYRGDALVDFTIEMASSSTIAEQQKLELWRMRLELAQMAGEGVLDQNTIYKDVFHFSDEKIAEVRDGKKVDRLEMITLEGMQSPDMAAGEAPAGESIPGDSELPSTLGGEPNAPPQQETQPESVERPVDEKRNPGSEGDRAEIAVDKGRNLFDPGYDQHELVFGTEKQTADDPNDLRSMRRLITRPFSESNDEDDAAAREIDERLTTAIDRAKAINESVGRVQGVVLNFERNVKKTSG